MGSIIQQFGINESLFIHIGLFCVLFFILNKIYFTPFMELLEERKEKTEHDRETAEKLMEQAEAKLNEYNEKIQRARLEARAEVQALLQQARQQESEILNGARDQMKSMTKDALTAVEAQKEKLRLELTAEVDQITKTAVDKLLVQR